MCGITTIRELRAWLWILILGTLVTNCYAHIGSCENHSRDCEKWKSWGYCQTNLQFMALNCPVSCNVCLDPGCFDRSPDCTRYAKLGYCTRYHQQLQRICPHSCNFCRIPQFFTQPVNKQSLSQPIFECGKPITRTSRQVIFPDELKEYIRTNTLKRQPTPIMRLETGSSGVDDVNVSDAFCGATPIHERFVLTAAHCVLDPDKPVRSVRLGELDFSRTDETNSKPVDYKVKLIIVHPDFKPNTLERYNDIALIETEQKIEFNSLVYPFCIPKMRPPPNSVVTGSGFGFVNGTHRAANLQEAELKVVDNAECIARYDRDGLGNQLRVLYPQLLQNKDIMCAAFPGRDSCAGDSGGPLFLDESGRRSLVGVVGSGIPCRGIGVSTLPGFYVSVADHVDFIDSVIYSQ